MIRKTRRTRAALIGVLVTLLGLGNLATAAPAAAGGGPWGEAEEQEFVRLINDLRTSRGLPALAPQPELGLQARMWSTTMRDRGDIFHSQDLGAGVTANWRKLGENVGVGGTVQALFDAFVASPSHFDNLVDPDFRTIGVGVAWDGNRMFTAHRFMAEFPPEDPAPGSPAPAPGPEARPAPVAAAPSPGSGPAAAAPAPSAPAPAPVGAERAAVPSGDPAGAPGGAASAAPAALGEVIGVLSVLGL